ncbi:MAG: DUF3098 domain-containing protein [Bacteroidetes bacterium]|nr:DUF3098 domain-containing protein [Bacteroidota bacterium]MBK9400521.1 DUF3098 domain-containing protein [Bacteroidota bacterium]MBL0095127.1 DUF3098 domain-containing protein [Bacteroidota bacterium]
MSKNLSDKKPAGAKTAVSKENINEAAFAFGRENYILLFISIGLLLIGYFLMAGGKAENPNVFNEEVFSFRRITLAPIVVMMGYALAIYAIVKKAD